MVQAELREQYVNFGEYLFPHLLRSLVHCDKYLCPSTLACVHFPHHCPCPFPETEDKFEFGDGSMLCVSKGGYKQGEAARKIELARKGML